MSLSFSDMPFEIICKIFTCLPLSDQRQAALASKDCNAAYQQSCIYLIARFSNQSNSLSGSLSGRIITRLISAMPSNSYTPSAIVKKTIERMKVISRSKGCLAELQVPITNLDCDTIDRKFIKMESQLQREIQSVVKHWKKIFDGQPQPVCCADVIRTVLASDRLASLSSDERNELFSTLASIGLVDEGSVEYRSAIFNADKFRGIDRYMLGQCLIQIALSGDLGFLNIVIQSPHHSSIPVECIDEAVRLSTKEGNPACNKALKEFRGKV